MKREYSIFEAKAKLSEIIRTVRNHHEVTITDRSEPVVKVVPIARKKPKNLANRLEELSRLGQISAHSSPDHWPKQIPMQENAQENLLARFLKERD